MRIPFDIDVVSIEFVAMVQAYAVEPEQVSGKGQIRPITLGIFVRRGKHDER